MSEIVSVSKIVLSTEPNVNPLVTTKTHVKTETNDVHKATARLPTDQNDRIRKVVKWLNTIAEDGIPYDKRYLT